MCLQKYIYLSVHPSIYTCMYLCKHVCSIHVCMLVYLYVCMLVCMYVCMYVCRLHSHVCYNVTHTYACMYTCRWFCWTRVVTVQQRSSGPWRMQVMGMPRFFSTGRISSSLHSRSMGNPVTRLSHQNSSEYTRYGTGIFAYPSLACSRGWKCTGVQ